MGTYDRQVASAKRSIERKGAKCIWRKPGSLVADPVEPWKQTPGVDVDTPVRILFVPENLRLDRFVQAIAGTEVNTGNEKGIMASVPFIPDAADSVIKPDGSVLQIDSIDKLAPDGTPILWYIYFKG